MVEHSAVNRRVASSNLARGAKSFAFKHFENQTLTFCFQKIIVSCNGAGGMKFSLPAGPVRMNYLQANFLEIATDQHCPSPVIFQSGQLFLQLLSHNRRPGAEATAAIRLRGLKAGDTQL